VEMNTGAIPRHEKPSAEAQIQALTMSILTTGWKPDVDAFVPLPGLGHQDRVSVPVQLYNRSSARFLIIGGAHNDELTYEELNVHTLRREPYGLTRTDGIITKAVTTNTYTQIDWVMDQVLKYDITSIALFTSPYHLLRSLGTAIAALDRKHMPWIPIVPISVGELDSEVPEMIQKGHLTTGHDMVAGENKRFLTYTKKRPVSTDGTMPNVALKLEPAHVASYRTIRDYMSWMRSEHATTILAAA
jgi:hypothetical protein